MKSFVLNPWALTAEQQDTLAAELGIGVDHLPWDLTERRLMELETYLIERLLDMGVKTTESKLEYLLDTLGAWEWMDLR